MSWLGMSTPEVTILRDCTACIFAYFLYSLRKSEVLTFQYEKVWVTELDVCACISVVNGKAGSGEQLVSYYRVSKLSSPIDVLLKCNMAH